MLQRNLITTSPSTINVESKVSNTIISRCSRWKDVAKDRNAKGTSSMDCRERGSHARGVNPTQNTSRLGTARIKEEEGADARIIVKD